MHELSLAQNMLELIGSEVPAKAILKKVLVTVGPLSGVCADSLSFCFEQVAPQFGHTEAVLEINEVPAKMRCIRCSKAYPVKDMYELCPDCGSIEREILSGKEFTLDSLELEEP